MNKDITTFLMCAGTLEENKYRNENDDPWLTGDISIGEHLIDHLLYLIELEQSPTLRVLVWKDTLDDGSVRYSIKVKKRIQRATNKENNDLS